MHIYTYTHIHIHTMCIYIYTYIYVYMDPGLIPGLGRSPGEGNGNPLQYTCLENSIGEEPGGLQSMWLQRVGHDCVTNIFFSHIYIHTHIFLTILHSLQDLSSLTRNWNRAPAVKGEVLTTGPLGTSPKFQIINKIQNNSKVSFLHSEYFSILKILSG